MGTQNFCVSFKSYWCFLILDFFASGRIRHFQAISGKTRQNQAPTGCLNRVFISSPMSQSCAYPISMPQGEIELKSQKRWWIHIIMVSWGHSLWLSEGLVSRLSLSLSPMQKERPSNKRNQIDTFIIRVCLPITLKPRGLGRRVAQGPHSFPAFSDISRQKTHQQNQSLSGFPVIVICFRLSKRIQAPFRTIPGKIRQNQAISGKIRQFQAKSGLFQAFSGKIRQNQAESGKIRQPIGSGKSLVRDLCCSKNHKLLPLFGQSFFGCIPSKLKPKQTTIKLQAMASFFPRHGNCADKS